MFYCSEIPESGKECQLIRPYKGKFRGTIIGREFGKYVVEFSDGTVENFDVDEIYF